MSQWPIVSLGSKVRFLSGGTPTKEEPKYWNGSIPWVSSAEMTQRRISNTKLLITKDGAVAGSKLVPSRTVLVVVRGMSLAKEFRVAITMREMAFNQDLKALYPAKDLDPRYLFYYLLSQNNAIRDSASEAAHGTKKLDMPVLEQWPLAFPPMPHQLRIASILSIYDDLIENNRRRFALLERMAEQLYREWFVRFRFPGYQQCRSKKGLPAEWIPGKLGQILELGYGKALKEENRLLGKFPVYGSSGQVGSHNSFLVEGPGIIVGRKGNVGSVHWCDNAFFPIDTAYFVRSDVSKYYLFFLLQTMNFLNNDAAVPGLSRQQAYANDVLIPPSYLIARFEKLVIPIFELRAKLSKANDQLTRTRDLLLPRLISGKLRVDKLNIQFPPSMQAESA